MEKFSKITVSCEVNCPVEVVWSRYTQPLHMTKWNFASPEWHSPYARNKLIVGSELMVRMEAKDGSFGFDLIGVYEEIIPHEKIVYLLEDGRKVETVFEVNGTKIKVTTLFDAEKENSQELQKSGWQAILNNFCRYVEADWAIYVSNCAKNRVCLWYTDNALEAARFYEKTFPNSFVGSVNYAPGNYPQGSQGQILTVEFTVCGVACVGINGGSMFKHSEAFSFQITTETQTETDDLWNTIVNNDGEASQCGWCKDKFGISWQITPRILLESVTSRNSVVAQKAFASMMAMQKIDVGKIEAALLES